MTPWTVAHQVSLSMGFSRQEYWSGLPFPSPEDAPDPWVELWSPTLQADSLPFELQYKRHWGFPGGSDGKASACNAGDQGLIPGSGRSLEKEMATHSSTLAWKIPRTEEPGRLQSTGVSKSQTQLS